MSFFSEIVGKDPVNAPFVNAKYHAIIDADVARNYAGRGYEAAVVRSGFDLYIAHGGTFRASDKAIIIYQGVGDNTIEFHTMNAGTGTDLAEFVVAFLRDMAATNEIAVTYYDNEKISALLKFSPVRVDLDRVDEGVDRTFRATFYLREAG